MKRATKIFLLILMLFLMVALGSFIYYPEHRAKNAVRSVLNDPDSAQFEGLFRNKKTGSVCGYVNAKNRMGGYVGRELFIVSRDGIVEFDTSSTEEKLKRLDANEQFTSAILSRCYEE